MIPSEVKEKLLEYQKNEITEYYIYKKLAGKTKSEKNAHVLEVIANEEHGHYKLFEKYSQTQVEPNRFKVWFYTFIATLFGLTFAIKLMEQGEESAQQRYEFIRPYIPEAKDIIKDEFEHEQKLINLLDEEILKYMGSVVLGLNDALVELTGALAGFTFALQNSKLIAIIGIITGFAAALSMAASEYLSTKTEGENKSPIKSALYTGIAYIITVILLIFPYLFIKNYYVALILALIIAILIIAFFNFFMSVTNDLNFRKQFLEMVIISLSVSVLSFAIGWFIRTTFGVDI